jgi:hypothetical protein
MATQTIQRTVPIIAEKTNGNVQTPRDLKTQINHADEVLYKKQLEPVGGKEDLWQGGDMFVRSHSSRIMYDQLVLIDRRPAITQIRQRWLLM